MLEKAAIRKVEYLCQPYLVTWNTRVPPSPILIIRDAGQTLRR